MFVRKSRSNQFSLCQHEFDGRHSFHFSLSLFRREHLLTHRNSNAIFFLWMARSKFTGQFIPAIATRLEPPLYMRRTNVFTVTEFLMVIVLTNIEQRIWLSSFFNIYIDQIFLININTRIYYYFFIQDYFWSSYYIPKFEYGVH